MSDGLCAGAHDAIIRSDFGRHVSFHRRSQGLEDRGLRCLPALTRFDFWRSRSQCAALYNRLGVAFRRKGGLVASAGRFGKALSEEGLSIRSATIARLELGKTLDLMGARAEALKNYRQVIAAEDSAGSRTEAETLMRRPFHN